MVMDRLFLLIFTVAVLVGTAGIILQVGGGGGRREKGDRKKQQNNCFPPNGIFKRQSCLGFWFDKQPIEKYILVTTTTRHLR